MSDCLHITESSFDLPNNIESSLYQEHELPDMMSENNAPEAAVELWRHSHPESTQIYAFKNHVSKKYKIDLPTFHELWSWSVDHPASFWEEIWQRTGISATKKYTSVGKLTSCIPHPVLSSSGF